MSHSPNWIPVSDKLPTRDGVVLIFAPSREPAKPLITTAWYDPNGHGWSLLERYWIDAITHWMPLPSGPDPDPEPAASSMTYDPMPVQAAFHESTAQVRVLLGGNRSGRTTALLQEAAFWPGDVVIVVYEEGSIGRTLFRILFETEFARGPILPPNCRIKWIKRGAHIFSLIEVPGRKTRIATFIENRRIGGERACPGTLLVVDECYESAKLIAHAVDQGNQVIAAFWKDRRGLGQFRTECDMETFRLRFEDNEHVSPNDRQEILRRWKAQGKDVLLARNEGRQPPEENT